MQLPPVLSLLLQQARGTPMCEFNMAVNVREGHSGETNLAGAKYWLTGDLGDEWGTAKKGSWVIVSFDPVHRKLSVTHSRRSF